MAALAAATMAWAPNAAGSESPPPGASSLVLAWGSAVSGNAQIYAAPVSF
jgi:hypothetical protein